MFPIGDDNPQINRPIATYTIIMLNVLTWIFIQGFGASDALNESVCQYGLIPADLFSTLPSGAIDRVCYDGAGWSGVLTSMFMHGGWMHLIGNMWFLWVFGDNVEDSMGSVRFAIFYVVCGLCAAAAHALLGLDSVLPMVGASGAIGGVMGAYIMLYPRVQVRMLVFIIVVRVPAVAMLGYWMFVQLMGGMASIGSSSAGVAFWAHVGGFAAGAILVRFFKDDELLLNHPHQGWNKAAAPTDIWDDPANRQ